ncbi:hypothetical protein [Paenarthrobacter sp. FR1]|uniref:hypothetical protein n=1 Tax=Paenarthrobacter sp. FR1 TaxID=3439548 RepID=UPI003DA4411F
MDWLFYNTRLGTILVSEWKRYPDHVAEARDTGAPWLLDDGSEERNPIEQVSRQQDTVRWALRDHIVAPFFPTQKAHDLRVMQCVFCPQIDEETKKERLRFGKLFSSLDAMCHAIGSVTSPEPLLVSEPALLRGLAAALAQLFRCTLPAVFNGTVKPDQQPGHDLRLLQQMAAIHGQIAELHELLAELMLSAAGEPSTEATVLVGPPQEMSPATTKPESFHQLIHGHVAEHLGPVSGDHDRVLHGVERSFKAIMAELPVDSWASLGVFGGAVKRHIEGETTFTNLLGTQLWKWCLITAESNGITAEVDETHQRIRKTC